MSNLVKSFVSRFMIFLLSAMFFGSHAMAAEWQVSRSSGDVWVMSSDAQPVSLGKESVLSPGDKIQTGPNGRVLLVRGEETMLIAPNSVVGLSGEKKDGLTTTILQQAGSILLEVEKRNVKHFEVETPFLAAVVKGTQFRVTVDNTGANVQVERGKVEVSDFKSGQIALVLPGQAAKVFSKGKIGLSLSGSGNFNPIRKGATKKPRLKHVNVPGNGFSAPKSSAPGQQVRALVHSQKKTVAAKPFKPSLKPKAYGLINKARGRLRISAPMGEVKLNFHRVTKGLARSRSGIVSRNRRAQSKTVWSAKASHPGSAIGKTLAKSNGHGNKNVNARVNGNGGSNGNGGVSSNGIGLALGIGNGNGKGKGLGLGLGLN